MDSGHEIETALRDAVEKRKDFERFADTVRGLRHNHQINVKDSEQLLSDLAKAIKNWP
jgi:hypothetical protein